MSSPLIPLALAGAAAFLLSSGKKRRKTSKPVGVNPRGSTAYEPPLKDEIPQIYGSGPGSSQSSGESSTWVDRQKALKAISQVEFNKSDGGSVSLCSKCDPGPADGKPGKNTRAAVKAFQAMAGLNPTGKWGDVEDLAMGRILRSLSNNEPISCDPLIAYPSPFACFSDGDGFSLMLTQDAYEDEDEGTGPIPGTDPTPDPDPENGANPNAGEYGPDELLVADSECNYILHQSDKWFDVQRLLIIEYALDGMTDNQAAGEINESMLADHIPLCLSLGRNGVGPGVRQFWDVNHNYIAARLQEYVLLPETLNEDAVKFGLL